MWHAVKSVITATKFFKSLFLISELNLRMFFTGKYLPTSSFYIQRFFTAAKWRLNFEFSKAYDDISLHYVNVSSSCIIRISVLVVRNSGSKETSGVIDHTEPFPFQINATPELGIALWNLMGTDLCVQRFPVRKSYLQRVNWTVLKISRPIQYARLNR